MAQISQFWNKIQSLAKDCNPNGAVIEVTNRCNAACEYCFIDDHGRAKELSTSQLKYVIDKLNDAGILFFNITGGEPFLRSDISELLEYLFRKNIFFCSIYSNGILLTQNHMSVLELYHQYIKPFRMTVFSHHDEVHDAYMKVPGALKTILKNGEALMKRGIEVHIALPILSFNFDDLEETARFLIDNGFPVGFNYIKVITPANNTPLMQQMISQDFYYKHLKKQPDSALLSAIHNHECKKENNLTLCRGINELVMIDTYGNIHPCTGFRNFIIGSIFEPKPISEILKENEHYLKLKSTTKDDLVCGKCSLQSYCLPCIASQHTFKGTIDEEFPLYCNFTKALQSVCNERHLYDISK